MNVQDFKVMVEATFDRIRGLQDAGMKEYAQGHDVFANFKEQATEAGIRPEQNWHVLAGKHWRGVCSWIRGHKSQREHVIGRIDDMILYLLLLRGMVIEQEDLPPGLRELPQTSYTVVPSAAAVMHELEKAAERGPNRGLRP